MRIDDAATHAVAWEAWAAQIAAMHAGVARLTADASSGPESVAAGSSATTGPGVTGLDGGFAAGLAPSIAAERVRARVLGAREGAMTVQDGLAHVDTAAADLGAARDVIARLQVVAGQATTAGQDDRVVLQRVVDRSVQDLEGIAEQARHHTLTMLSGTASAWSLPDHAAVQALAVTAVVSPPAVAAGITQDPVWQDADRESVQRVAAGPGALAVGSGETSGEGGAPAATAAMTRAAVEPAAGQAEPRLRGEGRREHAADGSRAGDPPAQGADGPAASAGARVATAPATAAEVTNPWTGRLPVGTPGQARDASARLSVADGILAQVQDAVSGVRAMLVDTIAAHALDQVDLRGGRPTGSLLPLQEATRTSASALVDATQAQFQALGLLLAGGTRGEAAAAGPGAH